METITILNGEVPAAEAKELLLELINQKISYYNLKKFSAQIRFNVADKDSEEKLAQLQKTKSLLKAYMDAVGDGCSSMVIESTVRIKAGARKAEGEVCLEAGIC